MRRCGVSALSLVAFVSVGSASCMQTKDISDDRPTHWPPDSAGSVAAAPGASEVDRSFELHLPEEAREFETRAWDADVAYEGVGNCEFLCPLSIKIHPRESGTTFQEFIAEVVAPNSSDPEALDYAPAVLDSFKVGPWDAVQVAYWCGDCRREALFVEGDGVIAEIQFTLDPREETPALLESLRSAAASFRWRQ